MKINLKILIVLLLIIGNSCSYFKKSGTQEDPIARVLDKYLYPSDIKSLTFEGLSSSDSTLLVQNFINKWVKTQLLLSRAELNLSEEQKNVEAQIENYRSSLLIYLYKQKLLTQKLDTIVDDTIIINYYNEHNANFILNTDIVKAVYIKLYKSAPNIDKIKDLYLSENEDEIDFLDSYCYQYAVKYDQFNMDWVPFDFVKNVTPVNIPRNDYFLKYNRKIEVSDSLYQYLVGIYDYRLRGDFKPLEMVKFDIRNIIINKRKVAFDKEIENQIFNDAQDQGLFEIY